MKRFLGILLAAAMLIIPAASFAAYDYAAVPTPYMLVVDANDLNNVFYERAADTQVYPASTTKLMTCILAIEAGNLDASVTVGDEVTPFTNYSSLMGLKSGETVTMRDLVYGLMLVSGNDAAAAIAVHVGGSIDGFVSKMNQKAQELGMGATHFQNPHGVQNENHYTTARDMAKLMAYALKNKEFCAIDRTQTYSVPASNLRSEPLELITTNRLLRAVAGDPVNTVYPFAVGGKTGDTDTAGKCLVAVAERDGARVIVALFGDKAEMYGGDNVTNNLARFVNAAAIFDEVFNHNFNVVTAQELNVQIAFSTPVENGSADSLTDGKLAMTANITQAALRAMPAKINTIKGNAAAIQPQVMLTDGLKAPILAGQSVGSVNYVLNGETLFSAELTADQEVQVDLGGSAVAAADTTDSPFAPTATPLIDKGRKEWGTSDYLVLTLVLLVVLLIALVVIFVISERKRRYERKRRRSGTKRRQNY
ncbi:MAG: D-alanyl-D-alanine carboxypeptidase family protein [Clostridia bacterium]